MLAVVEQPFVVVFVVLEIEVFEKVARVKAEIRQIFVVKAVDVQIDLDLGVDLDDIFRCADKKIAAELSPDDVNGVAHVGLHLVLVRAVTPDDVGKLGAKRLLLDKKIVHQRLGLLERQVDRLPVKQDAARTEQLRRYLLHQAISFLLRMIPFLRRPAPSGMAFASIV